MTEIDLENARLGGQRDWRRRWSSGRTRVVKRVRNENGIETARLELNFHIQ